jgi:hypothetical protein
MDFGGWKPIHGLAPGEKEAGDLHTQDREQVSKQNIFFPNETKEEKFEHIKQMIQICKPQ